MVKTTNGDKVAPCPLDHVNRQFRTPAPNMLWLSDFTYVSTWQGFAYVAASGGFASGCLWEIWSGSIPAGLLNPPDLEADKSCLGRRISISSGRKSL